MRKLKLIWDFKGPEALNIAKHHETHLKEFIIAEKTAHNITGFEVLNENHAIAYMVVEEFEMKPIRDTLKPHRGQLYTEELT